MNLTWIQIIQILGISSIPQILISAFFNNRILKEKNKNEISNKYLEKKENAKAVWIYMYMYSSFSGKELTNIIKKNGIDTNNLLLNIEDKPKKELDELSLKVLVSFTFLHSEVKTKKILSEYLQFAFNMEKYEKENNSIQTAINYTILIISTFEHENTKNIKIETMIKHLINVKFTDSEEERNKNYEDIIKLHNELNPYSKIYTSWKNI